MTNAVLSKLKALVGRNVSEACDLCTETLAVEHSHLLELEGRRVLCACPACAAEDSSPAASARYLQVERRAARLADLELSDAIWRELGVPVGLAFFSTRRKTGEVVATFPGRAGIIESFVSLRAWQQLEHDNPVLKLLLPEVEALLVRRTSRHHDYFRVSIDHCYELAELLRSSETRRSSPEVAIIQEFFAGLEQHTRPKRHSRRPSA